MLQATANPTPGAQVPPGGDPAVAAMFERLAALEAASRASSSGKCAVTRQTEASRRSRCSPETRQGSEATDDAYGWRDSRHEDHVKARRSQRENTDWPQVSLLMRACVGEVSPWTDEFLQKAENPDESIEKVDLDPGDEHLDSQLYFVLTMLVNGNVLDKASLVEYGEGLQLWHLLLGEYEPQWKSRKTALYQSIFNFLLGDDIIVRLVAFKKLIRQYQTLSKKPIDI